MSDVLQAVSEAMASLAERAGASVVRVEGRNRLPASGVIYRADGVIVTSNHIVGATMNCVSDYPAATV
ncbi:MAG: hypothetical protein IPM07_27745 [Anaerolineales bacterium]|nr:hypothetical protein [Anaerolineales bacterium]